MTISREKITGITFFQGAVDGSQHDSGSVYIEEQLDFTTGRSKGFTSTKYKLGLSDAAKALMHLETPFFADVEFVQVTNGNNTKRVIKSLKPVALASSTSSTPASKPA